MSLANKQATAYKKYDEVINHVLKSIAIVRNGGQFTPISLGAKELKYILKGLDVRVLRLESIPMGTFAREAMVFEVRSFKGHFLTDTKSFEVKYNQITNTIGFNLTKEYDRNFDQCVFVYQNDNMDEIKKHIDKVMYDFVVKEKLFSCTGESLDFEQFTDRHLSLLSMISI
jgi:hypothetical protein